MRVLQLLAEDTIGGTELHAAVLAERLDGNIHSEVATLFEPGPIADRLRASDVPVWSLGGVVWPLRIARLCGLLRARHFDVVHAYGIKASLLARLAVRSTRPAPVFVCGVQGLHITEVVEGDEIKGRLALALERLTTDLVDAYDVNSLGAVRLLEEAGIARHRLNFIPNAVDTAAWHPGPIPLRDRDPIVVCVARLVERKRQADLLDAAARLANEGISLRVQLIGDGPNRPALLAHASRLGIEIDFLGAIGPRAVLERLHAAVAFVLPSLWEGMPNAVLEAMACGVPVVASDVNGTHDVVQDGITGRLFTARDIPGLASALHQTLDDREAAQQLADAAQRHVSESYSLPAMLRAKLELYERMALSSG